MKTFISSDLLRQVTAEAAASPHAEICGLLLGRSSRIEEARSCSNVAPDPARRFEIDPAALLAAHREARRGAAAMLGCYHSHPAGSSEPSVCDAAAAEPNDWLWLIVGGGQARMWRAREDGSRYGRFDEVRFTTALPSAAE